MKHGQQDEAAAAAQHLRLKLRELGLLEWADVRIAKEKGRYLPVVIYLEGIPKSQSDLLDEAMDSMRVR